MCYTYDSLSRVTKRTIKNLSDVVLSEETYSYDAAGNITDDAEDTTFVYDTNNRLTRYNGEDVTYDLDGNMLDNGELSFTYDSANRLISAGEDKIELSVALEKLKNLFGIDTLVMCGGAVINGAFLKDDLVDEISLVVTPYVEGDEGATVMNTKGAFNNKEFVFQSADAIPGNGVHLKFSKLIEK